MGELKWALPAPAALGAADRNIGAAGAAFDRVLDLGDAAPGTASGIAPGIAARLLPARPRARRGPGGFPRRPLARLVHLADEAEDVPDADDDGDEQDELREARDRDHRAI